MTLPKISIVTPSFNQAQFIEETIHSIHDQNYPNLEHMVIDGGSTDGTVELLRRYEDRLSWVSEQDNGQTEAINKGFRQASGDLVAWLNSDDLYLPHTLRTVAHFFQQNPGTDLLFGDCVIIDSTGQPLLERKEIPFDIGVLLWGLNYICQPTVFMRRSLLDIIGYLDETLHYGMDLDYWLRAAIAGARIRHTPQFLAQARWHAGAKTLSALPKMEAELERIRNR
ncbi:MAG: glycosyltransferase family 2 protein, partial [Anaerolineae bacterium]|nr:glycosyltransferase family 2 protein [Anaerolineae bacterium]